MTTGREFRHNCKARRYASDDRFSSEIQGLAMAILELQDYVARQTEMIGTLTAAMSTIASRLAEKEATR